MARAVLIENLNLARKATVTGSGSPSPTVIIATSGRRPANMPTAILCDGRSNDCGESMTVRDGEEPSMTIAASCDNRVLRASVGYRIVKMSPRCIARFQSVPDWYVLPEKTSLAGTIIGNMVPPLLMQRVVESVL
jgi:DNA (cytosine-5)-methyltransferase 1